MCYKYAIPCRRIFPQCGNPPADTVFKTVREIILTSDAMSAILYPTVLVAEDSVDTRIMLKRAFELKGYRVFEAEDGQQALELARRCRPSLMVIDLNMPVMDGLETIRDYRRLEADGNHTPIIAITAYDVYGMEQAALETGCNVYLSKPLNLEELDRAVKSLGFLV
jgi:CheY-like chemotaxis protein